MIQPIAPVANIDYLESGLDYRGPFAFHPVFLEFEFLHGGYRFD